MAEKHNRVAEDVVEYYLFPILSGTEEGYGLKKVLEEHARKYLTYLSPWLIDVIWQNEGFNLRPREENGATPAHLAGLTNFGDNIEDEWFIVYLLFQLTKQFPGLVVKLCDSDEEFLLIEAANALPKWVDPETAENRVYVYQGNLHIIPRKGTRSGSVTFPDEITSLGDAVENVRTYPDETRAPQQVQVALQNRIKNFPDLIHESVHYAHCYIPASMAAMFEEKPQLVASAVRAFYYRDPVDLQCCRTFKYFRPGTRVISRVRLTRCLYAQLLHQKFQADKRSGWVMPTSSNPKFKSHDLGMKLAHGFEILCHKSDGPTHGSGVADDTIPTNDIKWQQYIQSLKDKNYFRNELEGSVLYNELLEKAAKFYQENLTKKERTDNVGGEILYLLKTINYDIEERRRAEPSLLPPDDDSWLTLSPDALDKMMKDKSGGDFLADDEDMDGAFDLQQVANSMKTFVSKISNIEGAEFPQEGGGDEDEDADIQFDGSGFINAMQEMFEFEDSGTDSSSDMSEYGWEEDSDNETKPKNSGQSKIKRPPSLDKYMDIMDRELAKTDVGKSFEKQTKPKSRGSQKASPAKQKAANRDIEEEDDDFQPVDIDLNTVKNLLESYGAQEGLPGPATTMLGGMGVSLPQNADNIQAADLPKETTPKERPPRPAVPPRRGTPKSKPARPAPPVRLDSKETTI